MVRPLTRYLAHSRRVQTLILLSVASLMTTAPVRGASVTVANGDFEINGGIGEVNNGTTLASWTLGPTAAGGPASVYVVDKNADVFNPTTRVGGIPSPISAGGYITLDGPGVGINNGFTGSPDGGFMLGVEPDLANATVSQSISGFTVGQSYTLSFEWAAAQVYEGASSLGATQDFWQVTLGSQTASTPVFNLPSQGFSGWMTFGTNFTATNTTETLSFLAQGGPNGLPPFLLLDSVAFTNVPEPATGGVLALAVLLSIPVVRRVRRRVS